ncbi:MAG: hypothetical protein DRP84_11225 [Spirochaetes bacterium]|nr:MAG: hypothetical protein DRP84_11225 [Spirochaetota bacterium]
MELNLRRDLRKHVPLRELHFFIANKTGEEPRGYITKEALITKIEELANKNPEIIQDVKELLIRYMFAGKGSVSWSIPSETIEFSKEDIENLIVKKSEGNPFVEELRPPITSKPALNKAFWLRDNLLKLEFVYADRTYFIEENYEIREIRPTKRAAILIRLLNTLFVIESRASFAKSVHLHKMVADILDIDTYILEFTDEEIENIKTCLNARKKAARHKRLAGDFDVVEVSAAPTIDDLDESDEYQNLLSGDELKKARYKFTYALAEGRSLDVTIYISKRGSIWFVSEVPEEVIDYVFSCVRKIKGI